MESIANQQQIHEYSVDNKELQLKYKINYLKLKRIIELNQTLKREILRERTTSSNASLQIINYTSDLFLGKDYTVPSLHGYPPPGMNPFNKNSVYTQSQYTGNNGTTNDAGCCTIM